MMNFPEAYLPVYKYVEYKYHQTLERITNGKEIFKNDGASIEDE